MNRFIVTFALLLTGGLALAPARFVFAADEPQRMEWKVDGVQREALVYVPQAAKTAESPVVFVFHGHGGAMKNTAKKFAMHQLWPEAIAVYPQGLNTPGKLTDPEGKLPGWQRSAGDQGDRDLKFFDAMLERLKSEAKVDPRRIYSTGHSNGGGFTYLLWSVRGDRFAAVAPCAASALAYAGTLTPKPVFHLAGREDKLVKFAWQEQTIELLRKVNQCDDGGPWDKEKWCTLYPSKTVNPVVACIHPGGHELPDEVPAMIVRFFKEHAKPQSAR
jgi:polyhydroxybutyrate depolymerase